MQPSQPFILFPPPRRVFAAILGLCLLTSTAAEAKPKGCFTQAEVEAEKTVRVGVMLRETAMRCDIAPFSAGTLPLWTDVDTALGSRFARATQTRRQGFVREFPKEGADLMSYWDGRLVMHFRHLPLTQADCQDTAKTLKMVRKKGFNAFRSQADKVKNEVRMDYKACG